MSVPSVTAELPFVVVDASMLALELALLLVLIRRDRTVPTQATAVLVATGLVGSAGALVAVFWAILYPNLNSLVLVFEALGFSMGAPPGLWMIAVIGLRDRPLPAGSVGWPLLFAGAATAGELLMGVVFTAAGAPGAAPGAVLIEALVSPWYLASSALVMAALVLWLPLRPDRRRILVGLAAASALASLIVTSPLAVATAMTGLMALTALALRSDLKGSGPGAPVSLRWIGAVWAAYGAMSAAGAAVVLAGGTLASLAGFGTVMSLVMFGELAYLLTWGSQVPAAGRAPNSELDLLPVAEGTTGRGPVPADVDAG